MANIIRYKVVDSCRRSVVTHMLHGCNKKYSLHYKEGATVVAPDGSLGVAVFKTTADAFVWASDQPHLRILTVRAIGRGRRLQRVPSVRYINNVRKAVWEPVSPNSTNFKPIYKDLVEMTKELKGWGKGRSRDVYSERTRLFWPTPPGTMFYDAVYVLD